MLNGIWLALVLGAVVVAAWTGRMEAVSKASLDSAAEAVDLVIRLTGGMVLFLGLVRVASDGGLLRWLVGLLRPVLRRLFPEVPAQHPAMGAILMNFAANMLGLGNAATPFGIKAMIELDRLNPHRGVATNAQALFLAINTSSIVLLPPTGTVMVRYAAGSEAPFAIWIPTLLATAASTLTAITMAFLLMRLPRFRARPLADPPEPADEPDDLPAVELPEAPPPRGPGDRRRRLGLLLVLGALLAGLVKTGMERSAELGFGEFVKNELATQWLLPLLIVTLVSIGFAGRVRVYDALIEGGREGLQVAVRIVPYLIAILVGVGMFRASGALELVIGAIDPLTGRFGVPAEALPMALLRPLSGSGAFGVMTEILETHGADSFIGLLTSTFQGSTETTFYVLAVYLGAVRIRDSRHILPACLSGDLAGFAAAVAACHLFFA